MTLTELLAEVYNLTNRPDLSTLSTAQVKAATLFAHTFEGNFFSKDIYETGVAFTVSDFTHSWDYISFISNFRELKYFRRVTDADDEKGIDLEILTPGEILDSYGINKTDIAYVAGRVLEIRAKVEFQFGLIGAYVFPIVTTSGFSSWIAEEYPWAIIHKAVSVIQGTLGQDKASKFNKDTAVEQLITMRNSALVDVGS